MDPQTTGGITAGPPQRPHGHWLKRAWKAAVGLTPTAVVFLVALSLGLVLVAVQMSYTPLLVVFAVVWGVTVIVLFGVVSRWISKSQGPARHRRMATGH
ncbi:hypothetical protein OG689_06550 [Kitasatospora sp. NBC_00240]|uniref:hypothetical protein n=1 Tax=Kitasatospora sp. NBC_00240 TaxID=2903567 RepID=UPI002258FAB0|nr:hypothetical protein [Kitasatospora sp. NBC_00240]MCX5208950.1 hypothetical protein [Kitasatospora sp. NBC_00240]